VSEETHLELIKAKIVSPEEAAGKVKSGDGGEKVTASAFLLLGVKWR